MGGFGKFLGQVGTGIASGAGQGLASGISGAIGGLLGGIGRKKREKRQLKNQIKLNEAAAKTNYEYGEKSAQNAYKRQMEMYERSYNDQSYAAMRRQMENAGLSVGLMYGGAGNGGGAGAMSGAPQGATGGAQAGAADSPAAQAAAENQRAELGLNMIMQRKDIQLKDAQINQVNATAEKERAQAESLTEDKITTMQTREWIVRGAKELANMDWIKRLRAQYEDENSVEDKTDSTYSDPQFEDYTIVYKGTRTQQQRADVLKTIAEGDNQHGQAEAARALASLNNNKALGYWRELQIEMAKANALGVMAAAQKLNSETTKLDFEHKYGIKMTPLQWVNLGKDGVELLLNAVGTFTGLKTKKITEVMETINEKWGPNGGPAGGSKTKTIKTKTN